MKQAVIAGGAGFLGSWMCDRLLDEGYSVVCVDNLHTGRMKNIEHLLPEDHFHWVLADVRGPLDLPGTPDYVLNYACPASPPAYQKDPVYTMDTCFTGTKRLAEYALDNNAVFFQASTSEVYGDPQQIPQSEDYVGHVNPIGPRSCYDEGKRAAESLLMSMKEVSGLRLKIARIFNTYGPRMDPFDGRVVSNFICQCLKNEPMTVHGSGNQTRAFCYVTDMTEGIYRLVFDTEDEFIGPLNLGNPSEMPVMDLARIIAWKFGQEKGNESIDYLPRPVDDPEKRKPDISRAMKVLNWAPGTDVEKGLDPTIRYYAAELGISCPID